MQRLQQLQDDLSAALGLSFVTVDYRGRPVLNSSGFTDFCSCMQKHEKYAPLCSQCYAHGGLRATMAEKPCIYRCHAGLVEFAVPLMVEGKYVGAIMGGQCELEGERPLPEPVLPQSTPWEQDPELFRSRGDVHKITWARLEAGVRLVQNMIQSLLEEERNRFIREELQRRNEELLQEKAARVNLELSVREEEDSGRVMERLDKEHLFYMLNVISRLAYLEKAEETERTACDFASMMRYVLENGEYHCVTLGEELEYIEYYLQIQKRRMEGRLQYEIRVPERHHSTLCPFMLLHPLVKNTVNYVLDSGQEGGKLTIQSREERNRLVLTVGSDCAGGYAQLPNPEGKRQESALTRMDHSLKSVFGREYGVLVGERKDGRPGREIQVFLPLNSSAVERETI